jgi:methionyl aminopeptidase
MVSSSELDRWRRAGRIAAEARELGLRGARPGRSLKELAEEVESFIRSRGAQPAFPANLSRNVEAAHFTPAIDDANELKEGDLLKVDVGAHIDGAIADTAMTVEVGGGHRRENLVRAARDALAAAVGEVHSGVSVDTIGRAVEATVGRLGLKPIRDLSGHTIEPYLLHAGTSVPNVGGMNGTVLDAGQIVALEPFVTNGSGRIQNGPFGNIVRFRAEPRNAEPSITAAFERFRTLPFTVRWLPANEAGTFVRRARRFLQTYPVFLEAGGGLVAQAEHTVLVTQDGAEVLTSVE